jgi:outer membrane protein assembly factor BamB
MYPFVDRESCAIPARPHAPSLGALVVLILSAPALAFAAAEWPMFRGNPSLVGVSSEQLPEKLTLLWSFKTGGPVKSSAAISNGKVFIGSGDGYVYCLKLEDGARIWAYKTGGEVDSSPLLLSGKVLVGSSDAFLYSLDASDGHLGWKYETGDKILGSPNWTKVKEKETVLVGSYDFKLHSVDALSGKTNWVYETGNYINGSPAVSGGQAVFRWL